MAQVAWGHAQRGQEEAGKAYVSASSLAAISGKLAGSASMVTPSREGRLKPGVSASTPPRPVSSSLTVRVVCLPRRSLFEIVPTACGQPQAWIGLHDGDYVLTVWGSALSPCPSAQQVFARA